MNKFKRYIKSNILIKFKKWHTVGIDLIKIFILIYVGYILNNIAKINCFKFGKLVIVQVILNFIFLICWIKAQKNFDWKEENFFKPIYWGGNTVFFAGNLFLNHIEIIRSFSKLKIGFTTVNIYAIGTYILIYILVVYLFYTLCFSKVKKASLTTSGFAIEVDDTPLSTKQHRMLNDINEKINRFTTANLNMHILAKDFVYNVLLNENNEVRDTYENKKLIDALRLMANEVLNETELVCDFKTLHSIEELKEEYNIPNNIFNKISAKINSDQLQYEVFVERNIIFIKYDFNALEHIDMPKGRIVGVIQTLDGSTPYVIYGNLLVVSLRLFDYLTLMLTTQIFTSKSKMLLKGTIENVQNINSRIVNIVDDFILNKLLFNGNISSEYTYKSLFYTLQLLFTSNVVSMKNSFTTLDELENIKIEFNLMDQTYESIKMKILSNEFCNNFFVEQDILIVQYKFTNIEDEEMKDSQVIITVQNIQSITFYEEYGRLLLCSLMLFDYTFGNRISEYYKGGEDDEN